MPVTGGRRTEGYGFLGNSTIEEVQSALKPGAGCDIEEISRGCLVTGQKEVSNGAGVKEAYIAGVDVGSINIGRGRRTDVVDKPEGE